jgi:hypothetical protein
MHPLKQLYSFGPRVLGCWEGKREHDICVELSGSDSNFWIENLHQCKLIIERHYHSKMVVAYAGVYMLVLYYIVKYMAMVENLISLWHFSPISQIRAQKGTGGHDPPTNTM